MKSKIKSAEEYIRDTQEKILEGFKNHQIVSRTENSWYCRRPSDNYFWFEVMALKGNYLYVYGDFDPVQFGYSREVGEDRVHWLGSGQHRYVDGYVVQKATIGNGGVGLVEINDGVWIHDAKEAISGMDVEEVPEWIFDAVKYGDVPEDLLFRDYESFSEQSWGEVPSARLLLAHSALVTLSRLLRQTKS